MELVENIVADSARVAGSARDIGATLNGEETEATESAPVSSPGAEIVAWQEVVLNMNAVCVECNTILMRGSRRAIGLNQTGVSPSVMCPQCLKKMGSSEAERGSVDEN